MKKKILFILAVFLLLAGCGSTPPPKTASKNSHKKYVYTDLNGDPASQDAIEDLIYSKLSNKRNSSLKKYTVQTGSHSLSGVKFDIPMTSNSRVDAWVDYFTNGSGRKHYARWLARSTRFVPTQLKTLKEYGLPRDIIFLSMIESGFNTHAYSTAAASGLWQFIRSTGRLYGLDSDYWVDERRDPEKATLAAARHLKDLYEDFGDWYLAFAAYNAGAGKVRRAIEATGSRNFWDLASSRYLRQETKDYVHKILAAAIIGKSPEKYGFKEINFQDPIATEKVKVSSPTDFQTIASCAGVEVDLVRLLNPELIRNMTPLNHPQYELKLPRVTAKSFEMKYAKLSPAERLQNVRYVADHSEPVRNIARTHGVTIATLFNANPSLASKKSVSKGTAILIPKTYESAPEFSVASAYLPSTKGNSLIDLIAERPERIKSDKNSKKKTEEKKLPGVDHLGSDGEMQVAWKENSAVSKTATNDFIASDKVEKMVIAAADPQFESATESENHPPFEENRAKEEKTSSGSIELADNAVDKAGSDIDAQIKKSLKGIEISTKDLSELVDSSEKTENNSVATQTKVAQAKTIYHQVKRGESLTSIAKKYEVSVSDLREWNKLKGKKNLLANQKITIKLGDSEKIRSTPAGKEIASRIEKETKKIAKKNLVKIVNYKVRHGDTLSKIARRYDVSPDDILKTNRLNKKSSIRPGSVLRIRTKELALNKG